MNKAGKAREIRELEAVVKVVYPEVIPEVEELDQMKNPCKHVPRTSLRISRWFSFRDDVFYYRYI